MDRSRRCFPLFLTLVSFFSLAVAFLCLCVFLILCDKGSQSILSSSSLPLSFVGLRTDEGVPAFVSLPGYLTAIFFLSFFPARLTFFGWLNGCRCCSRPLPPLRLFVCCVVPAALNNSFFFLFFPLSTQLVPCFFLFFLQGSPQKNPPDSPYSVYVNKQNKQRCTKG